ncbi:hypothetical protein [Cryobacterium sp. PH31-O1]|uniref:hypothetical protein n=1 Tax=Cryobacterium sp. PH31-O1 TaxID=3046306 RepID=UPI0024BBDC1D|nr:hypothetical protein [Cryobacterium sp. PH31-O1]MDJ0337460.1 hypothetical protein [Cryobacterium sp. PH31-O1]
MSTLTKVYGPRVLTKLDLMGIRFALEPAGDGGAGDPPPAAPVVVPPVVEPPKPAPPVEPAPIEGSADGGKTFDLTYVEKLRKENAKNRTDDKAAIQAQIDAALAAGQKTWATELGKKLGVIEDDKPASSDDIIAALTAERDGFRTERDTFATERSARSERDAINAASDLHKGNSRLVAAVLREDGLLKDIDPAATDYPALVAAVVKAEIEKDASLRAVPVAPRSGSGERPGGTPISGPLSIDDRRKAIREARASK